MTNPALDATEEAMRFPPGQYGVIPGMRDRIVADHGALNERILREQMGGIVGVAEVTDVVYSSPSPWFFGKQGLVISNARALPLVPYKGQLGFFNVPISALPDGYLA